MDVAAVLTDALDRTKQTLERALDGLSSEELHAQPRPDCNPIAWLAWHLSRGTDHQVASLAGREQVWVAEGWHQRFGMEPDPTVTGFRHTPEQVSAFRAPDAPTLLGYFAAVQTVADDYLATVTPEALDRVLDEPMWDPPVTVGVRLVSVVIECAEHAAQVAYVRGMLQGVGWQTF